MQTLQIDVKRTLGIGYFTTDYFGNCIDDMTWAQYTAHCSIDDNSKAMSFAEKQVIEEKVNLEIRISV